MRQLTEETDTDRGRGTDTVRQRRQIQTEAGGQTVRQTDRGDRYRQKQGDRHRQ